MKNNLKNNTEVLYDLVPPGAVLSQSLRSVGYDLETAIADLIDNSISAGAKNVWIDFLWDGNKSEICLTDDGRGLSESEIVEAMRAGSADPHAERDTNDLGRFGLGLKTASFSQCIRTTLFSKTDSVIAGRCWDLEFISRPDINEWRLLHANDSHRFPARLKKLSSGTSVLWEGLDRIVRDTETDNLIHKAAFDKKIDAVEKHLAMVFHVFLERHTNQIKLWINGNRISPWNPFLPDEDATQPLPEEKIKLRNSHVVVTPYILPHHSKIDKDTFESAAGIKGWNAHQGFYIYRAQRLLVAGDWLGFFVKDEHHKLARIRIDISNGMDELWDIDVKKSKAIPPDAIRAQLRAIAAKTRKRASEVYGFRGRRLTREGGGGLILAWDQETRRGKTVYVINRTHPIVKTAIASCKDKEAIRALLRLLEEAIPVPLIGINNSENPEKHADPFETATSTEIETLIKRTYLQLRADGMRKEEAKLALGRIDPCWHYPAIIEALED